MRNKILYEIKGSRIFRCHNEDRASTMSGTDLLFSFKINQFVYFWLLWVFVAVNGLSLVVARGAFSLQWLLLLQSTGSGTRRLQCLWFIEPWLSSRGAGLSCPAACGILPDQGLKLHALHWQANS